MQELSCQLIDNKKSWENFILSRAEANFLQSSNWGEFQKKLGKKIFPLGLFENQKQIAAALIIKEKAKRGNYLSIAGGPLLDWQKKDALEQVQFLIAEIKKIAKQENCLFIRFRPQVKDSPEIRALVKKLAAQESPMHLTADLTLQLDLNQSEEEILAGMRKNTRYEIRKAIKKGITVENSQDPAEIKEFYQHQLYLAEKHSFVPFSYQFLYQQFLSFVKDDQVMLFHAYHENKLLASAFIIFYNKEAVYHYGVSTAENQRLPGSYACQWAAIKEAKQRDCLRYNFWGIAPEDQKKHRFAGVSLFKRGFGGQEVQYLPAHDIAVSKFYFATKMFEKIRKKTRKL
ncbi:MAG: peptidoglycan bridge formation glycyltransferase FemA/FemB family protein [Candidatus Woesebacteria bacterium]|jgi:lipid II:glycine glycyltransferase (peptidoglycan interpeptide bridge formation enzyme)